MFGYVIWVPIWKNSLFKINNETWAKWEAARIIYIGDILNENGDYMNERELYSYYKIKCNFLESLQIKKSVPKDIQNIIAKKKVNILKEFKNFTRTENDIVVIHNSKLMKLSSLTTKRIYWALRQNSNQTYVLSKMVIHSTFFPMLKEVDELYWADIFKTALEIMHCTKLQSFQFIVYYFKLKRKIISMENY